MKITAVNIQNNNCSNKQSMPAFGMYFPQAVLDTIGKNSDCFTLEATRLIEALQKRKDQYTMNNFRIQKGSFDFNSHSVLNFSFSVQSKEGATVYKYYHEPFFLSGQAPQKIAKKIETQLKYLLTPKFEKKAAKTEAKELPKLKREQEKQRLLGEITPPVPAGLEEVLPSFTESLGGNEKQARLLLQELVQGGTTDKQALKEIAQEM